MPEFVDMKRWFSNGLPVKRLLVNKASIVSIIVIVIGTDEEGYRVGITISNNTDPYWADPEFTSTQESAWALADELQALLA